MLLALWSWFDKSSLDTLLGVFYHDKIIARENLTKRKLQSEIRKRRFVAMLRRLLLGQRKRQDDDENKEDILITQNKEEEKCESDEESETETEDSDNDSNSNSDTIEGSSVCSLDESFDNDDDTTQENKGFKMADSHDPARDELQLLGDSGNSENIVQEKERRETEEATKIHNETASDNGEVGEAKVSEEGHDDAISQQDRDTQPDNKKTIPNNNNNDDDNNNNDNNSSTNNNESNNNNNRRISRGQSFLEKSKASEKRPSRIPQTQSFPSENEIPRKSCKQVSCLQQPVQQQDHQVRDARGRVGSKGSRGESLAKKSQPQDVERNKPVLKRNVRNIKETEKRRMEMKSRKSSDSYETDSSVSKLVRILGIDIGELKDFIKTVKTEQGGKQDKQDHEGPVMDHERPVMDHGTTVPRKRSASREPSGIGDGNNGSSEDVKLGLSKDLEDILKGVRKTKKVVVKGDQAMEIRKSPDGCHSVVTENEERIEETQEETSSDSGVSETNGQRYMYINDVIKRKEHLTEEIAEIDARILVMEGHRKDLQVVHDLFDLCSDELKDVERNNAGAPCVQSLKEILKRQMRELADSELKRKMNGLESIGVPYFTAIQAHVEKLRVEINDSLQDDRKCRSKSLQKMRFEYGKVLGMCEGILACVYQQ